MCVCMFVCVLVCVLVHVCVFACAFAFAVRLTCFLSADGELLARRPILLKEYMRML
jgi:hypothetical protein